MGMGWKRALGRSYQPRPYKKIRQENPDVPASELRGARTRRQVQQDNDEIDFVNNNNPTAFGDIFSSSEPNHDKTDTKIAWAKIGAIATASLIAIFAVKNIVPIRLGSPESQSEHSIDPATQNSPKPRTCAEANRATEINIRNRRIQLLSGVDTVYLVCRGKGRTEQFIGRCIFSEASVPGPLSRPRNVQEAVDKIQLLDQETQATYCRPAALNIVNWANNYNFDQDEIVVPSIVRFEEVDPKNP